MSVSKPVSDFTDRGQRERNPCDDPRTRDDADTATLASPDQTTTDHVHTH